MRWIALGVAGLLAVALSACGAGSGEATKTGDVIAPITMNANDLQGADVDLVVGQVLNINTGDLAVESYTGEVSDPAVAEFVQGRTDGSAEFNPGVTALAEGTAEVTLVNAQGGIQPLEFTVHVST